MDTLDTQTTPPQDFDIRQLVEDARKRWLKPAEICEILNNHRMLPFSEAAPSKPESGSLFLFDRSKLRYFRKDGHNWRKKRDGRTVREAHEKLKADSKDVLHCYYAHGEDNPYFQRRSYWLLDREFEHIVLVHYREVTEGSNHRIFDVSARRLEAADVDSPNNVYRPVLHDSSHGSLSSPSEFQSTSFDSQQDFAESPADEWADSRVGTVQPLQQLQATFHKNLSVELDVDPLNDGPSESKHRASTSKASTQDAASKSRYLYDSRTSSAVPLSGPQLEDSVDPTSWSSYLASSQDPVWQSAAAPSGHVSENSISNRTVLSETGVVVNRMNELEVQSITTLGGTSQAFLAQQESSRQALDEISQGYNNEKLEIINGYREPELRILNEVQTQNQPVVSYMPESSLRSQKFLQNEFDLQNDLLLNFVLDDAGLITSLEGSSKVQSEWEILPGHAYPSAAQSFNILDFTPEWSYSCEEAKVIVTITGLDNVWNPSNAAWYCMFGEIAVPAEVICTGVLRCKSPLHEPGRVPFYVTCNESPSSNICTFEYCGKSTTSSKCSQEGLLLQVRLAEMLSTSEGASQTTYGQTDFGILETTNLKENRDSLVVDKTVWDELGELAKMESYLPCEVKDILLQTLLKHKLQHWIAMKRQDPKGVSTLGDHGVGVLHLTAALGYEWAIPALLSAGAGINFRDKQGKTALHWAAQYGREKMVALLLADGADPGALSDPTPKDPTGRMAADLAASSGHDGIAGYLAETSLTKHLVTLKLNENEMNKGSGVAADKTFELLSEKSVYELGMTEDQLSLKDTLAAVRKATQAAAGIQAVFRAISFQKKQALDTCELDEYGVLKQEAMAFAVSQTNQRAGPREKLNLAATQIQCKYRGWKDRKNFLTLKHHVVKIQAHFRGYQVRKYKKFLWMVGVMDKIILRWRRKGSGLRGFRAEEDGSPDNSGFMEVFRKQKEEAFEEALSRVKGMLQNSEARNQYRRVLENHRNELGAQATDVDELMSLLEAD